MGLGLGLGDQGADWNSKMGVRCGSRCRYGVRGGCGCGVRGGCGCGVRGGCGCGVRGGHGCGVRGGHGCGVRGGCGCGVKEVAVAVGFGVDVVCM